MKFSFKIFQSIVQKMFSEIVLEIVHLIVRQIFILIVRQFFIQIVPNLLLKLFTNEIFSKCIFVQFRVVYNCIGSWELGTFVCSTRMGQNDKMLHFQLPESPDLLPFCIGHYHNLTRFYNKYKNYPNIKNFYAKYLFEKLIPRKEGKLVFITSSHFKLLHILKEIVFAKSKLRKSILILFLKTGDDLLSYCPKKNSGL